jgi:hypothetical protein
MGGSQCPHIGAAARVEASEETRLAAFRQIRDRIRDHVRTFYRENASEPQAG